MPGVWVWQKFNDMIFSAITLGAANRGPVLHRCGLALCAALLLPCLAAADEPTDDAWIALGQATAVSQWHPSFKSPYTGSNSLDASVRNALTTRRLRPSSPACTATP